MAGGRMTALYVIANEYRSACTTTIADTLEGISGELETKAQNIAFVVRSLEADAAACKEWAKSATERAKAAESRAQALRDYLASCMTACGIEKISGPGVLLSFRKSSAVVINEPALIPAEFMRQPEPPPASPDKTAIAAAIKAGAEVPGAHVETRNNLQIK